MPVVLYERKGHIAYITLNRPEAYNAINSEAWAGLTKAWIDVRDDPEVRVAIVTGAGDKAFSSGADLKEIGQYMMTPEDKRPPLNSLIPDITPMRGLEVWKPFIAAINGIATGGGLELAMACDMRIAAENATLGLMEVKQSLVPNMSGTQRLPRLVPFGKAMEMLLTGDFIDAQEAYRIGLVNKVVPKAELMSAAENLANRIAENGPLAVKAIKEVVYRGIQMSLADGIRVEEYFSKPLLGTEDAKEGPMAFAQKRKPVYKGK
jgi:enoyl-CoA hydratase/carnithine racemase